MNNTEITKATKRVKKWALLKGKEDKYPKKLLSALKQAEGLEDSELLSIQSDIKVLSAILHLKVQSYVYKDDDGERTEVEMTNNDIKVLTNLMKTLTASKVQYFQMMKDTMFDVAQINTFITSVLNEIKRTLPTHLVEQTTRNVLNNVILPAKQGATRETAIQLDVMAQGLEKDFIINEELLKEKSIDDLIEERKKHGTNGA